MSAFELVAAVIAVFFGVGIAVGILIVVALPAIARYRAERKRMRQNRRRYLRRGAWEEPPAGDGELRKPPSWPGD
jgi:hypothetical protein